MSRISFCNFALAKELFKRNWYVSARYFWDGFSRLVPTISRMRYTVYVYSLDPTNSLSSYLPLFLTFSAFFTLAYCVVATCVNSIICSSRKPRGFTEQARCAGQRCCSQALLLPFCLALQ